MVMLTEDYDYVIGGDPDRDTVDLAVVDAATGGAHAHLADDTDSAGYARMLAWADRHAPGRRVWALEGTGSFAAGLATVLAEADGDVVEITGGKRGRGAKSDRIDAVQDRCRPRLPARRCPASSRPPRARVACGRRYGRFSLPAKRFWSAGPKPSTS